MKIIFLTLLILSGCALFRTPTPEELAKIDAEKREQNKTYLDYTAEDLKNKDRIDLIALASSSNHARCLEQAIELANRSGYDYRARNAFASKKANCDKIGSSPLNRLVRERLVEISPNWTKAQKDRVLGGFAAPGLTAEQVRATHGDPLSKNALSTPRGVAEAWHYGSVRITLVNGKVVSVFR